MVAKIVRFPEKVTQPELAPLRLAEDDFSVKVMSDDDAHFWVRIEKDDSDTVVVSDFLQGGLSEADLVVGLRMALKAARMSHRRRVLFRDIVPGGAEKPLFALRLQQTSDCVKRAVTAIAADGGRTLATFAIVPRGNKMDVAATLA